MSSMTDSSNKNRSRRSKQINKKDIKSELPLDIMKDRSMPICFTAEQYAKIEQIAKQRGMLNAGQLLEEALEQ